MMAKANITTQNNNSVNAFIKKIADEKKRKDFAALVKLISENVGMAAKMWGTAIVGFGSYHYVYESGREGDAPLMGLAARSNAIALYLSASFEGREALLEKLGKHKTARACVYVSKLEDIDTAILLKMVKKSMAHIQKMYPDVNH